MQVDRNVIPGETLQINVGGAGINGDNSYSPNPLKIQKGQTVTWYNGDAISHTVTSGLDGDTNAAKIFDSGAIIPNQHYSMTFDNTGDYQYYCIYLAHYRGS